MENNQAQQKNVAQTLTTETQCFKATSSSLNNKDEVSQSQNYLQGCSVFDATVNIVKSGLGTGILFLPSVFKDCGIILSIILMIVTGLVCYFCWILLSKVICFQESLDRNDKNNQNLTLEKTAGILFSNNAKIFLEVITMIYAYGTCLGYCIFIRDSTSSLISDPLYIILIMFAIYFPLSLFKQIQNLAFFNYLALIALSITIGCIIVKSIIELVGYGGNLPTYTLFAFSKIPLQFGVFSFAYDINGVVTEVHASMQDKTQFSIVLRRYLIISCVLGIIVGTLGYLAFGESTEAIIFLNFGRMGGFGDVISVLYSLTLTASILLFCFPLGNHIDNLIKIFVLRNKSEKTHMIQMMLSRTTIFFSFGILSIYVGEIGSIFNLLGCVFCTILTYITPSLLLKKAQIKESFLLSLPDLDLEMVKISNKEISSNPNSALKKRTLPRGKFISFWCVVILIFGLGGGISGVVQTIIDLQKQYS